MTQQYQTASINNPGHVRIVAAATDITIDDDFIVANTALGAFALTLPNAASVPGKSITIKYIDDASNVLTISPVLAQTIDGVAGSITMSLMNQATTLQSDGANWRTVPGAVTQSQVRSILLTPAADAAVAILSTTGGIQLSVTGAGNVAISTTSSYAGQKINLFALAVAGGGSYTLALDVGTLTLNAASEGATIMRNSANTAWVCIGLSGATIV